MARVPGERVLEAPVEQGERDGRDGVDERGNLAKQQRDRQRLDYEGVGLGQVKVPRQVGEVEVGLARRPARRPPPPHVKGRLEHEHERLRERVGDGNQGGQLGQPAGHVPLVAVDDEPVDEHRIGHVRDRQLAQQRDLPARPAPGQLIVGRPGDERPERRVEPGGDDRDRRQPGRLVLAAL